jgi:hypothetical protein
LLVACRQHYKSGETSAASETVLDDWELTVEEKASDAAEANPVTHAVPNPGEVDDDDSGPVGDMEDFVDEEIDLIVDGVRFHFIWSAHHR